MAELSSPPEVAVALAEFRGAFDQALTACDALLRSGQGLIDYLRQAGAIDDPLATALLAKADQIDAAISNSRPRT